jgi:SET domain-containing protein
MPKQTRKKSPLQPQQESRPKPKPQPKAKTRSKTAPAPKKKAKRRVASLPRLESSPLIEARNSAIHGTGVYAVAPIKKGARIIEYIGERISHAEADRRYERKGSDDGHTFLFIASNRTVIDATDGGNDARFINHSCNPNCETVIEQNRVFVEATRSIKPGDELGYDYQLTWDSTDEPEDLALYACRCGAPKCRGTMLDREPMDKKKADELKKKQKKRKK